MKGSGIERLSATHACRKLKQTSGCDRAVRMPSSRQLFDTRGLRQFGKAIRFADCRADAQVAGGQDVRSAQSEDQEHLRGLQDYRPMPFTCMGCSVTSPSSMPNSASKSSSPDRVRLAKSRIWKSRYEKVAMGKPLSLMCTLFVSQLKTERFTLSDFRPSLPLARHVAPRVYCAGPKDPPGPPGAPLRPVAK